ncbi:HlyD family secretion protein [Nitrosospira sp. Nsp5]|uniref:HlyD family secretion protein n=1 Tax=Nitrosospira multiformis TaxID=1231 RepID=A0ABY0T7Q5_9PROT|nr:MULTISPECIES: efflux RND transporter periplasmic adaptor subunit [Nitrosospira]PTR09466.1 HlyD family secretion protein [Nitrosospira sp. Nsp5]SDQ29321.1 HlyD family secretion protein [Nitrosospira multiformis]
MTSFPRARLLVLIVALLSALIGFWYWQTKPGSSQERYKTQAVDRGDIVQNISANGTLNPVVLVNVGTQVSGTVYKLYADFNDTVEEGQILVELDPSLFQAQLRQSEANVINARTALKLANNKMTRNRALVEQGFISPDALDAVEQILEGARAQLAVSEAQLARDRTNLNYSVIRSPISGVVIARNVDIGQTVAASFQTPVLFQIAKDLRQMQIDTSVAEADIGQLHLGQVVNFTVDAFQEREFTGTVKQVRLNPTIQQNVVSYNVVVAVENDEGVLLPGMTANVRFTVNQKKDVLRVPNAALRYKPAENDSDAVTPAARQPGKQMVYRLEEGKAVPISIKTGIADNSFTEILGDAIKPGDKLIIREVADKDKSGSKLRFRMF